MEFFRIKMFEYEDKVDDDECETYIFQVKLK